METRKVVKKTLQSVDWSGWDSKYRLVVAVLCDDFPLAITYMKRVGKDGEINCHDYLNWPVFQHFRKTQEFANNFKEIFGDQMTAYEIPNIESNFLSEEGFPKNDEMSSEGQIDGSV